MRINLALTAPKAPGENEREAVNNEKYTEDKIMVLLLAYDRRNPQLLRYLLDEGARFWPPKKTFEKLVKERLFEEIERYCSEAALQPSQEQAQQSMVVMTRTWMQMAQAILRSRTAHALYGSLSLRKRADFIRNLVYDLEADAMKTAPSVFREAVRSELTI